MSFEKVSPERIPFYPIFEKVFPDKIPHLIPFEKESLKRNPLRLTSKKVSEKVILP